MEQENNTSKKELDSLTSIGEDVSEAMQVVESRSAAIEQGKKKINELKNRING